MKRILYSCLFLFFLFTIDTLKSQGSFSISPQFQCSTPANSYTFDAAIIGASPTNPTSYSWTVISAQPGCTPVVTSANPTGSPANTTITVVMPCCGQYTLVCEAYVGPINTGTLQLAFQPANNVPGIGAIFCPTGAPITPSLQTICIGSQATITGMPGAATYTWSNGAPSASAIVVSPNINTCYSYTATTPQGCTVTPNSSACVNVQSASLTVSPASQSMCAGSPVSFTALGTAIFNTSVTLGTAITGYSWFQPTLSPPFAVTPQATHAAVGGNYSVVVTHTGTAGTCTIGGISAVVITTNIPVSISPTNPSVCPGSAITLTANSIQTAAGQFTWSSNSGGPVVVHPVNNQIVTIPNIQPVTTVTVDVNYFGCPGQATVDIGLLTLTPTLIASAPLTCPGQSLTLTAYGADNYTFSATPSPPFTPTLNMPNGPSTNTSIVVTPVANSFPIQYCVSADSVGCVGNTCIIVSERVLTPSLSVLSALGHGSVCPNTQFTLTALGSGVGVGSTYTFSSNYAGIIPPTATANIAHPIPPLTGPSFANSYTVTVDSLGCKGTATAIVNLLTLTPTLSSSSPSICAGKQFTLTSIGVNATSYTFTASHPQFTTSATSTVIITGNSSVTHTPPVGPSVMSYTLELDSLGCKGSDTHTVGILDLGPTLTLTTLPLSGSVCPGQTVNINATGSLNYSFLEPPSFAFYTGTATASSGTITGTATTPTLFPLGGIIYTVQADSGGCVGSKTIIVNELKLNPQISVTPTLVCSGQTVVISATGLGAGTGVTYQFYSLIPPGTVPSTLLSSPGSFSTTDLPTFPTIYSVMVFSAGCTGVFPPPTASVDIRPDLVIIPSASSTSVCPGLTTTLSITGPTIHNTTYNWTAPSNGGSITPNPAVGSSVTVNPILNSTYTITALDTLGCVGDTIINIGIDPTLSFPIVLSSSGSTICPNQSVTLSATSTVSTIGNVTYTWSPLTGIFPKTQPTPTVIGNPSVTTMYTVTADNGYGCVAQNTITIPVGQFPVISSPNISHYSVCPGFTSTITANGAVSYTWAGTSFTGGIVQPSISVVEGNYTITGSNGGGCISQYNFTIFPHPPLNLSITAAPATQTTCITQNIPFKTSKPVKLTASGAGTYVWFPYDPTIMTYSLGPQTDVRPPATMNFTVIGSTDVCSGTQSIQITVIPQFTMNVTPPLPAICLGDSIKLDVVNVSTKDVVGPVSSYTYSWGEALNAPPISMSDYFGKTVTVFPQNTTTYTVDVKDARGCISFPKLVTVTVLPQPLTSIAVPTINNVPTNTVCFVGLNPGPLDITLNLTANNGNQGLPFGLVPTYTWVSPYMPSYNTILSPANGNMVTINAPIRELNNSAVAVYSVISGYNGVAGCRRVDTVSVRVVDCRPAYTASFTTAEPNDTICSRTCITYINLADTMSGGPQSYVWNFEGGSPSTSTEKNPTVCYNFPSVLRPYNVTLKVSNPYPLISTNGPSGSTVYASAPSYVRVVDVPNVTIISPGQLKSDTTIRFGKSVNLKGSGALTYEWSPAYNITSLTKTAVTVNPFKTTQYILTGFNSRNCASSDTINVIVVEDCGEMYVPNAFTPNNDGTNDVLYVRGICLQSLTFMVFNRWGEKVFETADQNIGWDGSYKGEALNTGVFVYRLEGKTYEGKGFTSKGNITLIR